jgi:cell division protein FtsA
LNGGIILTGGGSQLKHLLQLTEYMTGLNARIGIPNEHLSGGVFDSELSVPMYSTCLGLILKGYNDYENKQTQVVGNSIKSKTGGVIQEVEIKEEVQETVLVNVSKGVSVGPRTSLKDFMDSIKNNLIELFKEEEDKKF